MAFFNRKEEVLDIKLTPYGRYLLARDGFNPEFYAFYDDDIVYDASSSYVEVQNDIQDRIKETPRMHTQTCFREKSPNLAERNNQIPQNFYERNYSLVSQIGNSDVFSDFAPAWDATFLKGEITSSALSHTSSGPTLNIPQINAKKIEYQVILGGGEPASEVGSDPFESTTYEYDDGTYIRVKEDYLLLEINEKNSSFDIENYDIELFEIDYQTVVTPTHPDRSDPSEYADATIAEVLVPLHFINKGESSLETSDVGYFLSVQVDGEIPERDLCKYKGVDTVEAIFADPVFECGDVVEGDLELDIYQTSTVDGDLEDIC
tara:strand:+ start:502 stop:1458 length:957 start_codon:yes stop_codon:yes gene_type:complete